MCILQRSSKVFCKESKNPYPPNWSVWICPCKKKLVSLKADPSGFSAGSFFRDQLEKHAITVLSTVQLEVNIMHPISWTEISLV